MKYLRLLAFAFVTTLFFTACDNDDPMDDILNDTELESVVASTDDENDPPTGGN